MGCFLSREKGGVSIYQQQLEIEAMRTGQPLATDNKRETAEWEAKRERLGLG